jgi:hypothetical protein
MERIKSFSNFSINESTMVDNNICSQLLDAMEASDLEMCLATYDALQTSAPKIFADLQAFAETKGVSLEDMIAEKFKKLGGNSFSTASVLRKKFPQIWSKIEGATRSNLSADLGDLYF